MLEKKYVIGLDVSTAVIGITICDLEGKLVEINSITLPKASKKFGKPSIYDKADYFKKALASYENYNILHVYIEEPLKNGPNINTTILLAKFNGIVSQIMYETFNVAPIHITVYDARKIFFPEFIVNKKVKGVMQEVLSFPKDSDTKKLVFDKVTWLEPHVPVILSKFFNIKVENYDRADSYVVTKAGLFSGGYIKIIPKCPKLL